MEEVIYKRVCRDCGIVFPSNRKERICPDCKIAIRKRDVAMRSTKGVFKKPTKKEAKMVKPKLSIQQVLRIQNKYNQENEKKLSYGDIVKLIDNGKIKI